MGKSIHSMGAATARVCAPAHRLDESPVGYSLAGWSPPEPASALQPGTVSCNIVLPVDGFSSTRRFQNLGQKRVQFSVTFLLGGHLKTGHTWSLQNRPTGLA